MKRAYASELLKLRSTRTSLALTIAAVGLTVLIAVLFASLAHFTGRRHPGDDVLGSAGFAQLFALVLGILAVTSEFRHGTITPSLLVVPDRARLVLAKLGATVTLCLVLGVICVAVGTALGLGILSIRGIDARITTAAVTYSVVGEILAVGLFGALGVGIGALVRNQVGAIVGTLATLFVVLPALGAIPDVGDTISKYSPSGAASALADTRASDVLAQVPGGLLLVAWCAVFLAGGIALMRRRDIG